MLIGFRRAGKAGTSYHCSGSKNYPPPPTSLVYKNFVFYYVFYYCVLLLLFSITYIIWYNMLALQRTHKFILLVFCMSIVVDLQLLLSYRLIVIVQIILILRDCENNSKWNLTIHCYFYLQYHSTEVLHYDQFMSQRVNW